MSRWSINEVVLVCECKNACTRALVRTRLPFSWRKELRPRRYSTEIATDDVLRATIEAAREMSIDPPRNVTLSNCCPEADGENFRCTHETTFLLHVLERLEKEGSSLAGLALAAPEAEEERRLAVSGICLLPLCATTRDAGPGGPRPPKRTTGEDIAEWEFGEAVAAGGSAGRTAMTPPAPARRVGGREAALPRGITVLEASRSALVRGVEGEYIEKEDSRPPVRMCSFSRLTRLCCCGVDAVERVEMAA